MDRERNLSLVERSIEKVLADIKASNTPQANKDEVLVLVEHLKAKNSKDATIAKWLYAVKRYLQVLGDVEVRKATKQDLEKAVAKINRMQTADGQELADWTKSTTKKVVKYWYKFMLGDDEDFPKVVSWMKKLEPKQKTRVTRSDILTEVEVVRMISNAQNLRDKAIISLLYDTAIRGQCELLKMKKKDVILDDAIIIVSGKTGVRTLPLEFSLEHMTNYMNSIGNKSPTENLWRYAGNDATKNNEPLEGHGLRMMLAKVANRAKINKHVYPHLLRHTRLTIWASKFPDSILKKLAGWSERSNMPAVYCHLNNQDAIDAVRELYGNKPKVLELVQGSAPCPRCQTTNAVGNLYCRRCGSEMNFVQRINSPALDNLVAEKMDNQDLMKTPEFQRAVQYAVMAELKRINNKKGNSNSE